MIPETRGHEARFVEEVGGHRRYIDVPVIAWDDQGNALIADMVTAKLVPATSRAGFEELVADGGPLGVIPGGGWRVSETFPDGAVELPVVAWSISVTGYATPIVDVGDGLVGAIVGDAWTPIAPGKKNL